MESYQATSNTVTNTYNKRLRVGLDLQQPTGVWTNQFIYDAARRLTSVTSKAGSFGYVLASGVPSTLTIRLDLPNTSYITMNGSERVGSWYCSLMNGYRVFTRGRIHVG